MVAKSGLLNGSKMPTKTHELEQCPNRLDGCCRTTHDGLCSFGDVHESETLGALLISLKGFNGLGLGALRGIVRLATNEAAEEGGDDGLRNDDLVVN